MAGENAVLMFAASPFPCDASETPTHVLNGSHQRKGQRHGAKHVEAELCASLGIGSYSARVVVCHTGNKARSDSGKRVFFQAGPKMLERTHALPSIIVTLKMLRVPRRYASTMLVH